MVRKRSHQSAKTQFRTEIDDSKLFSIGYRFAYFLIFNVIASYVISKSPGMEMVQYDLMKFMIPVYIAMAIVAVICKFMLSKCRELKNETDALEKVTLEDPEFNKRFNVYSLDQTEASYLLTTAFMERFYSLKTVFGSNNIKCSFYEDKLMIAISTNNDLFELGDLFKSVKNPKNIYQFYRELSSILNIIDALKLGNE